MSGCVDVPRKGKCTCAEMHHGERNPRSSNEIDDVAEATHVLKR
jgi:hypothetical protein